MPNFAESSNQSLLKNKFIPLNYDVEYLTCKSNGYQEKSIPQDSVSLDIWNHEVRDLVWFKWYDIGDPTASVGVGLLNEILSTLI